MKYIFDGFKAHIYEVGIDVYEIQYSKGFWQPTIVKRFSSSELVELKKEGRLIVIKN
ncbi:MAG: hypothetical protein IKI40_09305 [Treponema sp.]|nr:hypothetical protein [Treponema sp.]